MSPRISIALLLFAGAGTAAAQSRSSANYTLVQESSSPGLRSTSGDYTLDDSSGSGVASSANYLHKDGFAGQLTDPASLNLTVTPNPAPESSSVQLGADLVLDDDTLVTGVTASWSPIFGPVGSIQAGGLAQTGTVYQDTGALVAALYLGVGSTLPIVVTDTDPDNFQSYAADGLADAWQVGNFGLPPNSDAAPGANPDMDPYDNEFEFLTGYDPNDGGDFFRFVMTGKAGGTASFTASKLIPGTRYTLERTEDLGLKFDPIGSATVTSESADVIFLDKEAPVRRAFYQMAVEAE